MPLRYSDDLEPLETELARWRAKAIWWAIIAFALLILWIGTAWMFEAHAAGERIRERFSLPSSSTPAAARSVRV